MNEATKEKVNATFNQSIESFKSWNRISTSIHDIQNQIKSLNRVKWDVFEMPEYIKENLKEALDIRLTSELQSLSDEIKTSEALLEAMELHKSWLQNSCSRQLQRPRNLVAFEALKVFGGACNSLRLLVGMRNVSLDRIAMEEMESSKALSDANEAMKKVQNHLEDSFLIWNEICSDL